MPCYFPLQAYRARSLTKSGKRAITFDPKLSFGLSSCSLKLPCGQCHGCRLEHARQWAMRCMHEASLHDFNCFVTLTYSDDHLPSDRSLDVREFQLFMKKLRKHFSSDEFLSLYPVYYRKSGIRFYHCGEYGESKGRPHYHALLFSCDFPDKKRYIPKGHVLGNGIKYFTSDILDSVWGKGRCVIGEVTFESASYVARYCMKKQIGDFYLGDFVCKDTGLIRKREYSTMSRRSGERS